MRASLAVVVVAACSSSPGAVADAPSADAPSTGCDPGSGFTPVTVTGTSPVGPLDIFHYATAHFVSGDCSDQYLIAFTPHAANAACYGDPTLEFSIGPPFEQTGPHPALVFIDSVHSAETFDVTFDATVLDPPSATPPHLVGRFTTTDPAWAFDIAIDLTSQLGNCL